MRGDHSESIHFSAAAGGGHIRTAQALEQYINHHVVDEK